MSWWVLYSILAVVVAALVAGFIFLRKKMKKRLEEQQSLINQQKIPVSILVLGKRKDKIQNANIPKSVAEQVPKIYRIKKLSLVRAKIGSQVMDLICEDDIFDKIPEKKTVRVELAGIFIAGILPGKK